MRALPIVLCALAIAVLADGAAAQTLPSWGCNASPSCRQNGFSTYTGQNKEHTGILFDVSWDHGFRIDLARHPNLAEEAPKLPEQRFHLHPPSEVTPPPDLRPTPSPPGPSVERQGGDSSH